MQALVLYFPVVVFILWNWSSLSCIEFWGDYIHIEKNNKLATINVFKILILPPSCPSENHQFIHDNSTLVNEDSDYQNNSFSNFPILYSTDLFLFLLKNPPLQRFNLLKHWATLKKSRKMCAGWRVILLSSMIAYSIRHIQILSRVFIECVSILSQTGEQECHQKCLRFWYFQAVSRVMECPLHCKDHQEANNNFISGEKW